MRPPLRSAAQDSRHAPRRPAWLQLNADPTGQVETNKTQQEKQAEVCWPFGTRLRPKVWTEEGIRGRAGSHISVIFESVRGTRRCCTEGFRRPTVTHTRRSQPHSSVAPLSPVPIAVAEMSSILTLSDPCKSTSLSSNCLCSTMCRPPYVRMDRHGAAAHRGAHSPYRNVHAPLIPSIAPLPFHLCH